MFNYKYEVFIFNWKLNHENVLNYENIFKEYDIPVTVINSSDNFKKNEWVNIGDESFFSKQWNTLLEYKKSDSDFIIHIQSDAFFSKNIEFLKKLDDLNSKFPNRIGIYAPNVNFTHHTYDIDKCVPFDTNIYSVTNTDCTYWAISNKLLTEKVPLFDLDINSVGWGADWFYSAVATIKDMLVLRDYNFMVDHEYKTGYNSELAEFQFRRWVNALPIDIRYQINKFRFGDSSILT
jgi:hypothetical protein